MAITKKGIGWEIGNSLWIILSFLAFFNGLGMCFAGKIVKVKKWCKYGLIYVLISGISFFSIGEFKIEAISSIATAIFLISWIVCIVHSFMIRREYLLRLEFLQNNKMGQVDVDLLKNDLAKEYGINNREMNKVIQSNDLMQSNSVENKEKLNNNINNNEELKKEDVSSSSLEYNPVTPEIPKMDELHEFVEQKDLLDINSCTESELADLPGVGLILAKKAINLRKDNNGFTSVDEFIEKLCIKPHFAGRLKDMICCIPIKDVNFEPVKTKGRMVDF